MRSAERIDKMKLYIKQKVFSWGDRFRIYDENEHDWYYVQGEVFSLGKKLHLYGTDDTELAFISQKVLSFLPKFYIHRNGTEYATVRKEFTLFRQKYTVDGPGWTVDGNFLEHEYVITDGTGTVATVSKRWFSWGDTYEIDISDRADEIAVLCVVLVIDAVLAQQSSSSSASFRSSH